MWVGLLDIVSENVRPFSQSHESYARIVLGLGHECSFPVHRSPFINSMLTLRVYILGFLRYGHKITRTESKIRQICDEQCRVCRDN